MPKILIVDDELELLDFLRDVVEMMGHQVHTAESGAQGVAAAELVQPDLVIQDVVLNDFDGWTCMTRIRALPDLHSLPFIFCSGSLIACETYHRQPPPQSSFLKKPFDITVLEQEMRRFLSAPNQNHCLPGPWTGLFL